MKYFILFSLFTCLNLFSQEKKIIYLNENHKEVDHEAFTMGMKTGKYLDLYFENDTLVQCLLVRRRPIGR